MSAFSNLETNLKTKIHFNHSSPGLGGLFSLINGAENAFSQECQVTHHQEREGPSPSLRFRVTAREMSWKMSKKRGGTEMSGVQGIHHQNGWLTMYCYQLFITLVGNERNHNNNPPSDNQLQMALLWLSCGGCVSVCPSSSQPCSESFSS